MHVHRGIFPLNKLGALYSVKLLSCDNALDFNAFVLARYPRLVLSQILNLILASCPCSERAAGSGLFYSN